MMSSLLTIFIEATFPAAIGEFHRTEYLMVFVAIIFGYVGAEYFLGWGAILRNRKTVKVYWMHFLWTIFSFLLFTQNWFGIWPRTEFITKNFFYFFYALVPIFIFYLINVILFPNIKKHEKVDLKEYFEDNVRWLFCLFALYFLFTIISSFVYDDPGDHLLKQNLIRGAGVALSLIAAYFHKNKTMHLIFLIIGYAALAGFIIALPSTK